MPGMPGQNLDMFMLLLSTHSLRTSLDSRCSKNVLSIYVYRELLGIYGPPARLGGKATREELARINTGLICDSSKKTKLGGLHS